MRRTLSSMQSKTQQSTAPRRKRLLDLQEVAEELAVSFDTVDRYIRSDRIPFVRLPSGRRRIAREDLDRAIEQWTERG
jgi:excisionase family DNA binding protein